MATYIALIDFTAQGIRTIKDSPRRADAFLEAAKRAGATVRELYWTLGAHDGVLIVDAPDDTSASKLFLALCSAGNVRTQTLRAFGRSEMETLLDEAD